MGARDELLARLDAHIRAMAPHQRTHQPGVLLVEARALLAAQYTPAAEIAYAGVGDTRRLQFVAVRETLPDKTKLYTLEHPDG